MNRDSDEIAKSASEEYTYSGYTSAVTLPPQREALTERDYRVLFEILPQGILCQDRAGRIVMANPAAHRILVFPLVNLRVAPYSIKTGSSFVRMACRFQSAIIQLF